MQEEFLYFRNSRDNSMYCYHNIDNLKWYVALKIAIKDMDWKRSDKIRVISRIRDVPRIGEKKR
jgi:hypothetical protein